MKKGCKESAVTIAAWVAVISNNNFGTSIDARELIRYKYPPKVKVIKRNELLKYITIRDRKKMAETVAVTFFDQILEMYPQAARIHTIWNRYHEVIMGEDPDQLDGFLNRYEGTCIQPLINGIKKDIAAVKHAISYPHSSGFVEGGNTRFKAVNRWASEEVSFSTSS